MKKSKKVKNKGNAEKIVKKAKLNKLKSKDTIEDAKVIMKRTISMPKMPDTLKSSEINPLTGSRFKASSARQCAFEVIVDCFNKGMTRQETREELKKHRKDTGCKYNLDAGYFNFVVGGHPEYFKFDEKEGKVVMYKEPKIKTTFAESVKADEKSSTEKAKNKIKKVKEEKIGKVKEEEKAKKAKKVKKNKPKPKLKK
jgi:hypothetical protein